MQGFWHFKQKVQRTNPATDGLVQHHQVSLGLHIDATKPKSTEETAESFLDHPPIMLIAFPVQG